MGDEKGRMNTQYRTAVVSGGGGRVGMDYGMWFEDETEDNGVCGVRGKTRKRRKCVSIVGLSWTSGILAGGSVSTTPEPQA